MLRLLARAIFGPSASRPDDPWKPIIEAAIEKAVDATDPRLRALHDYKRKLRGPVTCAANFVHELGEGFPTPLEMSQAALGSNASTRGFFSSPARIQEVFSTSLEVQAFLQEPDNRILDRFYAALRMTRTERQVLAPVLEGDQIRQDVERTLVSFDEHQVVLPSPDEARLRRQLKERAFTTLLECALARMAGRSERNEDLKKRRALLRAKLRVIQNSHSGLDSLSGPASGGGNTAALQQMLDETEHELHEQDVSGDALERSLADLRTTLEQPADYICVQQETRRLDKMNFLLRDGDRSEPGGDVEFVQIEIRGRPGFCAVLATFPVAEIRSAEHYRDRMRRALDAGR